MTAPKRGRPRIDHKGRLIHNSLGRAKLTAMVATETRRAIAKRAGVDADLIGKLYLGLYEAPQIRNALKLRSIGIEVEDWFLSPPSVAKCRGAA